MAQSPFLVRKVAILGAGVMEARRLPHHMANANVAVLLFDLTAKEGDANGIARKAIDNLRKLEPSPLAMADRADYIDAANYDQHLARLGECDLVIEAISERMDWKRALYEKVAPHIATSAIFASNTSGLSINALGDACPEAMRSRFCGIHFFNPPRYMHLVELIPQKHTDASLLDQLETFLVTTLGKGVVRAKDTPNFVANRVGIFSMLATMVHTEAFGLGFDVVDALTGPAIGRARSATYPHCRRRRAGHHGARLFAPWNKRFAGRSLAQVLSPSGMAPRSHRQRRARPENQGRRVPRRSAKISRYSICKRSRIENVVCP